MITMYDNAKNFFSLSLLRQVLTSSVDFFKVAYTESKNRTKGQNVKI